MALAISTSNLKAVISEVWLGFVDLIFPPICLVCGEVQEKYLCTDCASKISFLTPPLCHRCAMPLVDGVCNECRDLEFAFDTAYSVGAYEGVLRDAIHAFKYKSQKVLSEPLSNLMIEALSANNRLRASVDVIVPVPIHLSRKRLRGFNQAELLAAQIGRAMKLPVVMDVLIKSSPNRAQIDLPLDMRKSNVEGVFSINNADAVYGRRVMLVDDVFTTGSTCDSASVALRSAGVREIHVFTLARSV